MAAWVRDLEKASGNWERKREAEEADKVEVAPGATVGSLRCLRAALIGTSQGLPKRRPLCLQIHLKTLRIWFCRRHVFRLKCEVVAIPGVSDGSRLAISKPSLACALLVARVRVCY